MIHNFIEVRKMGKNAAFDKDTIRPYLHGAVRVWEDEGWLRFCRFTKKQMKTFDERGVVLRPHCSSGMLLEASGRIERISFDYEVRKGSAREYYGFDFLEDGVRMDGFTGEGLPVTGHYEYVPTRPCRVTVVLPNLSETRLKNVVFEGTYEPVVRKTRVYFAGDSITQGYDALVPIHSYANEVTEALQFETLNQAVGGDVFEEANLDPDLPFDPELAIVAYGINDWSKCRLIEKTADAYLKKLRELYPGIPVFVLLPIWHFPIDDVRPASGLTLENARLIYQAAAERNGCIVLDGRKFLPQDPELYYDHRTHPNDKGFSYYAKGVLEALKAHGIG